MTLHFPESFKEQWQRVIVVLSGRPEVDDLAAMYRIELQELHSAEQQLCALVEEIGPLVRYAPLAGRLSEYGTALRMRKIEISKSLAAVGARSRTRRDGVMCALVEQTYTTAERSTDNVRDTALMAALQRIIHYMIADYATLASHANALGRKDDADRFSLHAQLNQDVDHELSKLVTSTLSVEVRRAKPHMSAALRCRDRHPM